jgi:hypothetical protein
MDVLIVKQDLSGDLHTVDEIVQTVETTEQRGLATAGGTDQSCHMILRYLHGYRLECEYVIIPEVKVVC